MNVMLTFTLSHFHTDTKDVILSLRLAAALNHFLSETGSGASCCRSADMFICVSVLSSPGIEHENNNNNNNNDHNQKFITTEEEKKSRTRMQMV